MRALDNMIVAVLFFMSVAGVLLWETAVLVATCLGAGHGTPETAPPAFWVFGNTIGYAFDRWLGLGGPGFY